MSTIDTTELIKQAQQGDSEAKNKAIKENLKLVSFMFSKYFSGLLDRPEFISYHKEDIMQVGTIALDRAIDVFDETKGNQFSTLACTGILREFAKYKRDKMYPYKIPVKYLELSKKMKVICEEESKRLGRSLTQDEIALNLGIERYELAEFLSVSDYVSLDKEAFKDTEDTMHEIIPAPSTPTDNDIIVKIALNKAFESLENVDKKIIEMFYFEEYELEEIGRELGRTRNSVYSRKQFLLTKLRRILLEEGIEWEGVK